MAVYVAVLGFQGIISEIAVHRTMSAAMTNVTNHLDPSGYSAERWFELLDETNEYPDDDYEPTNIYECELED